MALLLAQQDLDALVDGGKIDALLDGFDAEAARDAIAADISFHYGALHDENAGRAQQASYVESRFLTGAAREAAISARVATMGDIRGALSSGVTQLLYPLAKLGTISGGSGAAAENANIVAGEVDLSASADIGKLAAPVDLDFTKVLNPDDPGLSASQKQQVLDELALRRSLQ
ncbi:hypothetical protein C5F48_24485, partial [Cereibacter changlensis JA139]